MSPVYMMQPVVKPVVKPFDNRFDNRLYRVNGVILSSRITSAVAITGLLLAWSGRRASFVFRFVLYASLDVITYARPRQCSMPHISQLLTYTYLINRI